MMWPTQAEAAANRRAWADEQLRRVQDLSGVTVSGWRGVEMAVRDGDGPDPQFGGADVPCLVFLELLALLDDGTARRVGIDEDDGVWGLCFNVDGPDPWHDREDGNGYRSRDVTELPVGAITVVKVRFDAEHDVIAEVVLRIGAHELLLMAGEPEENWSGRLTWRRLDESVLVFTDPARADDVSWTPERIPNAFRERPAARTM